MSTTMLIETTGGLHEARTENLVSTDAAQVAAFLKGNCKVMGFTVQYAVDRAEGRVIDIIKSGRLTQAEIARFIAAGFDEWLYSWAFAGTRFRLADGREVGVHARIDLMDAAHAAQWCQALFGLAPRQRSA